MSQSLKCVEIAKKNNEFKCAKKVSLRWDKCLISYEIVEMIQSLKCVEIATNDPSTIVPKHEHLSEMCQKWGSLWNVFRLPKTIQVQFCQKTNTSLRCAKTRQIRNFSRDHRKWANLWNVLRLPKSTTWTLLNLDFLSAKNNFSKHIFEWGVEEARTPRIRLTSVVGTPSQSAHCEFDRFQKVSWSFFMFRTVFPK